MAALPQGGSRAAKHWGTGSLSCLSVGCDINTQKWLTLRTHPSPVFISEQDFWVGTDHEVYLMIRKEGVGVCVCVQNLVQLLSICPLFIIPPFSPFCQTFSPPHYGKTFLSLSYPLCRHSLSSVLCRPHVYISFVSSPAFFPPDTPRCHCHFCVLPFSSRAPAMIACNNCLLISSEVYLSYNLQLSSESRVATGQEGQNQNNNTPIHLTLCLRDLLLSASLLENSLFSTVQITAVHFILLLILVAGGSNNSLHSVWSADICPFLITALAPSIPLRLSISAAQIFNCFVVMIGFVSSLN